VREAAIGALGTLAASTANEPAALPGDRPGARRPASDVRAQAATPARTSRGARHPSADRHCRSSHPDERGDLLKVIAGMDLTHPIAPGTFRSRTASTARVKLRAKPCSVGRDSVKFPNSGARATVSMTCLTVLANWLKGQSTGRLSIGRLKGVGNRPIVVMLGR
jgi:hypothetical protein